MKTGRASKAKSRPGQVRYRCEQIEGEVEVESRSGRRRIGGLERKMATTAHKPTKQTTREPSSGLSVLVGGWSARREAPEGRKLGGIMIMTM